MKRILVAAVVAALALAGCTVPSQDLAPGVAFSYNGAAVSNERIDDLARSWDIASDGKTLANRNNVLTLELLADDLVAAASDLSDGALVVTDALAKVQAQKWLTVSGIQGEPSDELVRSFRTVLALYVVYTLDTDGSVLREIAQRAEDGAVTGSRSGQFSADALITSSSQAANLAYTMQGQASSQEEADLSYIAYAIINGFVTPDSQVRHLGDAPSS